MAFTLYFTFVFLKALRQSLIVLESFKTTIYPFHIPTIAQARNSEDTPHKVRLCKHKLSVYRDASLFLPQLNINSGLRIGPTQ